MTIGTISLAAVLTSFQESGHWACSHSLRDDKAPQPNPPEASEWTWMEGASSRIIKAAPCQSCRKQFHHARSALADVPLSNLGHQRKQFPKEMRPGFTTTVACDRWPSRDSKSDHQRDRFPLQCPTKALMLSWGSLSSRRAESRTIPKNVTVVLGPLSFGSQTGTPRSASVPKAVCKAWLPSSDSGDPKSKNHLGSE